MAKSKFTNNAVIGPSSKATVTVRSKIVCREDKTHFTRCKDSADGQRLPLLLRA